jgi:dihydroneopterin aldolase
MDITNYSWLYETLHKVIFQNRLYCYEHVCTDLHKFIYDSYTCTVYLLILCLLVYSDILHCI